MNRLGYTKFVAQGGDWGAIITDVMAAQGHPELVGIHSNVPGAVPPEVSAAIATGGSAPALRTPTIDDPGDGLACDDILDNITLTNTGVSSARLYWENRLPFFDFKSVSIPVAVSVFPGEFYQTPLSWAKRAYPNLTYYNKAAKGGHFPAWEEPLLFSQELRAGFRSLRT
jgi:pimeloyl-ACP methyl ester carboxylesterase